MKGANKMDVKEIDVALIFMLEEEKNLFLDTNDSLIVLNDGEQGFTEFIFFDKNLNRRKGVICSSTNSMGNTEAGILFFKLSRRYKAHLYINIGVSCHISEIQIGDVLICNRISTLGENNANNTQKQPLDLSMNINNLIQNSVQKIGKMFAGAFSYENKRDMDCFKQKLQLKLGDLDQYEGLNNLQTNNVKQGWCVTVSEVIKDRERFFKEAPLRKVNVIDMEAYYFGKWFQVINDYDPEHSCPNSIFMAFKSVSDYGDTNKSIMEECGSRKLAMKNLCFAVCSFCTAIYDFPTVSNIDLYSYFTSEICKNSLDKAVTDYDLVCNQIPKFESSFKYLIHSDDINFDTTKSISSAVSLLGKKNNAVFLTGRSGTGKSTFISVLYKHLYKSEHKKTILVDFSRFGESTTPSEKNLLYWLKVLIKSQKELYFLLDGISIGSSSYDALKEIFKSSECDKVSFCVGKYNKDLGGSLYETISARNDITDVIFYSVNVSSPYFENYVSECLSFLDYSDEERVKNFIANSKVCSVDFRFLYMASLDSSLDSKNLHTFVRKYVSKKFEIAEIAEYSQFREPKGEKYYKINTNSYSRALAIVSDIVSMFSETQNDFRDRDFRHNEFVLSNDMNLMLEQIINSKADSLNIIRNIIKFLSEEDVNISCRTQLLYNISKISIESNNHECSNQAKELVSFNAAKAKESFDNFTNRSSKMNNIIMFRTMSILNYLYFKNKEDLDLFNKMMLSDSDFLSCNLHFHLFYYSKLEFVFSDLIEFDKKNIDYEMFHNTYYILDTQLEINEFFSKQLINKDSFIVMNIITFLDLLQNITKIKFVNFQQTALNRVHDILSEIKRINDEFGVPYSDLISFAEKVQAHLKSLN